MKVMVLRGREALLRLRAGERAQIYVTNYDQIGTLVDNYILPTIERNQPLPFDTLILDELTKLKSPSSKRRKTLKKVLRAFPRRWGLTGTPNPNSLLELWAQISLLDDGVRFGPSFSGFQTAFFRQLDFNGYTWGPKPGAKETIYARLSDLALVQRSEDFLGIPPTITEDIEITLGQEARENYIRLERDLLLPLKGGAEVIAPTAAVLVSKLQQFTSGVVYETREEFSTEPLKWHVVHDHKLDALEKLVRKLREPVLIATNFRHERARVLERLPEAVEWTDKILPEWNAGKVPVLVADPRSIGHGLNLQSGGRTVVWFSLTYSRELYDQFNARLARKGQSEETFVYRLIAEDTIDCAISLVLKHKGEDQRALLDTVKTYQLMLK